MNIVVLDGATTNPGDISWGKIEKLGDVTIYGDSDESQIVQRAKNAEILISNRIVYDENLLNKLPKLKYIGTLSTGYNAIDLKATKEKGIVVSNVPSYCATTVAQMAFSLLLELCNHCKDHSDIVKSGNWDESISFGQKKAPFTELFEKTMGIVGYGDTGRIVAQMAKAFGMNVIAYSKSPKEIPTVSLEEVFSKSDVVSVHLALNSETANLIDINLFKLMKKTSFFINTARGGIVNQKDLAFALENGIIAGAGLDVLDKEPPEKNCELFGIDNCIITPHIAWSAKEARQRLVDIVAKNIEMYQKGTPQNQVNK
ncbi:MAG: D-2-hydroxyacid dehydrogenase [Clostridia bacterium]